MNDFLNKSKGAVLERRIIYFKDKGIYRTLPKGSRYSPYFVRRTTGNRIYII